MAALIAVAVLAPVGVLTATPAYAATTVPSTSAVFGWGFNSDGQLGNGTTTNSVAPVAASGVSGATAVSAGSSSVCAVVSQGAVECWGSNVSGQLGNGTTTNSTTPVTVAAITGATAVSVAGSYACAVVGGAVDCWGNNDFGQLGNGTTTSSLVPITVSGISGATAVATGSFQTCALLSAGTVECWGLNQFGQLGNGSTTNSSTPSPVTGLGSASAIAAGADSTCAVVSGGTVECWGDGTDGQLGDGTTAARAVPAPVTGLTGASVLAAHNTTVCAVIGGGAVDCWGNNVVGQLGNGTTTNSSTPVAVTGITGATAVATGSHSCAVVAGGSVSCWGNNLFGQLGDGTTTNSTTPVGVVGVAGATAVSDGAQFTVALVAPPKANQTITFAALPNATLLQSPVTVVATASSGLTVTFTTTTPLVCTAGGLNGATITLLAPGTCTVQADQAGNAVNNPAPSVTQSFAVSKANQTITFRAFLFDPVNVTVVATASSGLTVTLTTTTPLACTAGGLNGATLTLVGPGTCTVQADQAGNAIYNPAPSVTQSFPVQTITFGALPNVTLLQSPVTVSATASSGLTVTFTTTTPAQCTAGGLNGATITLLGPGTCTVQADQAGNAVNNPAPSVTQSFAVSKANQTITFGALPNANLAQLNYAVPATASSGLTVTFTTTTPLVCTPDIVVGVIDLVGPGTCAVQANQAGNAIYTPAPSVTQSFTVTTNQTITFGALPNATLPQSPVTVSATASSGLTVTFTTTTPLVCTTGGLNGATITLLGPGTCTVQANQAGNAIYNPAPSVTQSFTVSKANQTITFTTPAPAFVGATATLVASGGGSGNPVVFSVDASSGAGVCTLSGANNSIVSYLKLGSCVIDANQAGNANYLPAAQAQETITVKKNQTIAFAVLAKKTLAQSPVTVSAKASSGLTVTFTTTTTPLVCTAGGINGATITLLGPGTCTVQANQAGNAVFNPAPSVSRSFTVSKASQTIAFGVLTKKTLAQSPVTVSAKASSGLTVTFTTTTTPLVCTASGANGATITLLGRGTCTVQANQAGNAVFNPAPSVNRSFTVN